MTEIKEGDLTFSFPSGCQASKYEDWSFYRRQFQAVAGGSKTVDILCIESDTSWLIEIKDHREHSRRKSIHIGDEVANKVRDTLAGLAAAAKEANGEADQRRLAQKALRTSRRWRVVLHLEQPATGRRLQPNPIDPANLLLKLKKLKTLKAIDAHPIVCDQNTIPGYIPWIVQ